MRILMLWHWIAGYVSIRVEGPWVERFLNLLISNGIAIWDIRHSARMVRAKVSVAGFKRLRPYARRTRSRVRIERKSGLRFFAIRLENRSLLAAGALVFVVTLYILTSFVWIVRVTGTKAIDPQHVLSIASRYGLRAGARKASLDLREIERNVVLETRGLSWAKIKVQGTVYIIEVIENTSKPPDLEALGPCDVIAAKDGTITSVLVLMGRALVKEGAKVTKGQVLVSGAMMGASQVPPGQPPGSSPPQESLVKYLHARAIIKAKVTYTAYHETSLSQTILVPTGVTAKGIGIRIGRTQVVWRLPFPRFDYERVEAVPAADWFCRNTFSFVEFHKVTYHQLTPEIKTVTREQAVEIAQRAADDAAHLAIPESAEIESVEVSVQERSGMIGVTLHYTVIEEIGIPRPVKVQ